LFALVKIPIAKKSRYCLQNRFEKRFFRHNRKRHWQHNLLPLDFKKLAPQRLPKKSNGFKPKGRNSIVEKCR